MKDINEYICNNEEPINEGLLALCAVLLGASLISHLGFKTLHKTDEKIDAFWKWTFDNDDLSWVSGGR